MRDLEARWKVKVKDNGSDGAFGFHDSYMKLYGGLIGNFLRESTKRLRTITRTLPGSSIAISLKERGSSKCCFWCLLGSLVRVEGLWRGGRDMTKSKTSGPTYSTGTQLELLHAKHTLVPRCTHRSVAKSKWSCPSCCSRPKPR